MTYDLIIIGSGILGASHAFHAAKKGLRVLMLEKNNKPIGSTTQNFGQVVPSGLAGKWFEYGRRSLELYTEIQMEADISVRKNGSVYVASNEDELLLINELHAYYQTKNYPCTLLGKRQTVEHYPELNDAYVLGSLLFQDELSVEPDKMIHRLLLFLQVKYGVVVKTGSLAIEIEENSRGIVTVTTAERDKFSAPKVMLCCGATANVLYPEILAKSGLIVSKLQMLQTIPQPKIQLKGNILTGLTIRRYESFTNLPSFKKIKTPEHLLELQKWGIHLLFKQAENGSIIVGDSHEYAPIDDVERLETATNEYIDGLIIKEAQRIVRFPVHQIAKRWAGFYAQHEADIFLHGVSKNILVCTGIGGKGMTSSLGFAEQNLSIFLEQ